MAQRTTIVAPDELLRRLRVVAAERGTSMAELIREALEEKVAQHRPKPKSLGIGDSGRTDIARRTGEEGFVPEPWR
jgi:plasmid stability protein